MIKLSIFQYVKLALLEALQKAVAGLITITALDDIWAGISNYFNFEGIFPIAIKQQFGSLGSLDFS